MQVQVQEWLEVRLTMELEVFEFGQVLERVR